MGTHLVQGDIMQLPDGVMVLSPVASDRQHAAPHSSNRNQRRRRSTGSPRLTWPALSITVCNCSNESTRASSLACRGSMLHPKATRTEGETASMTQPKKPHLPIGYWIKKADELLTERINEVQRANGLTRTEWQILNSLHETSGATKAEIVELLRPFASAAALEATVDQLIQRGLVEAQQSGSARVQLTAQGRDLHARALEVQQSIRRQAVQGITDADYVTTVRVLQQIVENLSAMKRTD